MKIYEQYQRLKKNSALKYCQPETLKKNEESFVKESSCLLIASKSNIFQLIRRDEKRDKFAKQEDISFLQQCMEGKMGKMSDPEW